MSILKQYLEEKKITQRQFARQLGCTTAFLNNILNKKNTDIKISLLNKIYHRTRIPVKKLIDDFLEPKNNK